MKTISILCLCVAIWFLVSGILIALVPENYEDPEDYNILAFLWPIAFILSLHRCGLLGILHHEEDKRQN